MKIYNGCSGCGKSLIIKNDVESFINIGINPSKILILCLNPNRKEKFTGMFSQTDINILTFNELTNLISKKDISLFNKKRISDITAINIIFSIYKNEFQKNDTMKNLTKSKNFARELYNLFGLFKVNSLNYNVLSQITKDCDISQEDKNRFQLVLNVYKNYCDLLKTNNLEDYKDSILNCINQIKLNTNLKKILQNKYEYIIVDSAQNISKIQLELISQFIDKDKINLYGDSNAKIQTFMGANAFNPTSFDDTKSKRNTDIMKRALFINGDFISADKSESIAYRLFFDMQSEIDYIAKDIIEKIKQGAKYNDFAILIRDNSIKQNITDLLSKYEIPMSNKIECEDFRLFKQKFIRTINIFELLEKLSIPSFEEQGFLKMQNPSKTDLQTYLNQLNLLTENILRENLNNRYLCEQLYTLQKENHDFCLFQTILRNLELFDNENKVILNQILNTYNFLFENYKKRNYTEIAINIFKEHPNNTKEYNRLFAQFLSSLNDIQILNNNILNDDINIKTIFDLLENEIQDDIDKENSVNILTFFKSAGLEFKYIYIPSLTENYFPKKAKSTLFISDNANKKLSCSIKKTNPNFETIIFSAKEEMRDERNLLYVAMTRAKNKIILSTHSYEGKTQIPPSTFFEAFHFADEQNFISSELEKLETETLKEAEVLTETTNINNTKPVIEKNAPFSLSASSISKFLSCPKRFYFQRLLGLKEESNFQADYGTAVHAVLEILFNKYLNKFSKDQALELGKILFNSHNNIQAAEEEGFDKETIEKILSLNDLSLNNMKENFTSAINAMDTKGFFEHIPLKAICEQPFEFEIDKIKNIKFSGKIDTIIKNGDFWSIDDYKTGSKKTSPSKLFTEDALNFIDKGEFSLKKVREFQYQLPIYYLASLYSEEFKEQRNKIEKIGYSYIYPEYKGGYSEDFIETAQIEQYKDKLIDNIQKYIVDELYSKTEFEAIPKEYDCKQCGFSSICSQEGGVEEA